MAEEAVSILKEKGLQFKAITLTAKEKMCILDEPECDPIHCPRAKGHFDRINAAVYEMLTECDSYTREEVLRQAEKWNVCPHEFQFDVASWVDGVICDYNYAFDPTSKLKRFFAEGTKGDYIFLIDEAHNLVERGRDMFSATLVKEEILKVRQLLRPYAPGKKLEKALNRCNHQMLVYKRECDSCTELESVSTFLMMVNQLLEELAGWLEAHKTSEIRKQVLEFYFNLRNFSEIYNLVDENYLIYTSYLDNGDFALRLFCVNRRRICSSVSTRGGRPSSFPRRCCRCSIIRRCSARIRTITRFTWSPRLIPRSGVWRSEARSARSISGETAQSLRRSPPI